MEGIITWNIFLVGFLTELCLYIEKDKKYQDQNGYFNLFALVQ